MFLIIELEYDWLEAWANSISYILSTGFVYVFPYE